ncbi:unnamed protein product [Urochloa humidicola]
MKIIWRDPRHPRTPEHILRSFRFKQGSCGLPRAASTKPALPIITKRREKEFILVYFGGPSLVHIYLWPFDLIELVFEANIFVSR